MQDKEPVLALDLGGSHVAAAVVDGSVQAISSSTIHAASSAAEIVAIIQQAGKAALAAKELAPASLRGIAMAAPGPFDYEHGISWMQHKHAALYGLSLRQAISRSFGLENDAILFLPDAAAFLMGEIRRGGLQDVDRIVGITLGTGVGSAFAFQGQVVTQGTGVPPAGEIYNLPWASGIVEDEISTQWIVSTYRELSGEWITVKEIAGRTATDRFAGMVMEQFGVNLGRMFDTLLRDFDPKVIVLGGGISKSCESFLPGILRQFTSIQPRIHVCEHLNEAPLLGAAEFWRSRNAILAPRSPEYS